MPSEAGIVLLLSVRVFASVNLYVCLSVCAIVAKLYRSEIYLTLYENVLR